MSKNKVEPIGMDQFTTNMTTKYVSTEERDRLAEEIVRTIKLPENNPHFPVLDLTPQRFVKAGYDARDKEVALLRKLTSFARHAAHCVELAPRDCDGDIIECKCGFDKARAALAKGGG